MSTGALQLAGRCCACPAYRWRSSALKLPPPVMLNLALVFTSTRSKLNVPSMTLPFDRGDFQLIFAVSRAVLGLRFAERLLADAFGKMTSQLRLPAAAKVNFTGLPS